MTPFFFGQQDRRLFGIYQPPTQSGKYQRAAILCSPVGNEGICAHRAMRRLATALAEDGFHTLRFDYFGTGDSSGEMADADPQDWATDVETALQELNQIVGNRQATLIGLRSGAAIAADVASKRTGTIDALVLWDPVAYVDTNIRHDHSTHCRETASDSTSISKGVTPANRLPKASLKTFMLITEHSGQKAGFCLPGDVEVFAAEFLKDVQPWTVRSADTGRVPMKVIRRIVTWLQ